MASNSKIDKQSNGVNTSAELFIQASTNIFISLKCDVQKSITLAHISIYHIQTKHINIQHNYIHDEVAIGQINVQYIPISEMITDGPTKAITHAKSYIFVKKIIME